MANLNSLMLGGYEEDIDISIDNPEPTYPDVPLYCCTEMNSSILSKIYFEACKRDPDGGIPGKAPYVITKTGWWPLGFGEIDEIRDDFMEGDYEFIIHPDRTSVVSLEDYSKTWVMYVGPEDETFWSVVSEFQKVPLIDIPDNPEEDKRKEQLEAKADFVAVETDDLPL